MDFARGRWVARWCTTTPQSTYTSPVWAWAHTSVDKGDKRVGLIKKALNTASPACRWSSADCHFFSISWWLAARAGSCAEARQDEIAALFLAFTCLYAADTAWVPQRRGGWVPAGSSRAPRAVWALRAKARRATYRTAGHHSTYQRDYLPSSKMAAY